jgi:hypothetical protein
MHYHIKQVESKWVVYTSGRTYSEWIFPNEESARDYLDVCKGLKADHSIHLSRKKDLTE